MCGCGIDETCYGCPCGCRHLQDVFAGITDAVDVFKNDNKGQREIIRKMRQLSRELMDVIETESVDPNEKVILFRVGKRIGEILDGKV